MNRCDFPTKEKMRRCGSRQGGFPDSEGLQSPKIKNGIDSTNNALQTWRRVAIRQISNGERRVTPGPVVGHMKGGKLANGSTESK